MCSGCGVVFNVQCSVYSIKMCRVHCEVSSFHLALCSVYAL